MFKEAPRKNLGDLASFINGSAFKPEEWSLSGLPIVRIQNLTQEDAPFNYYEGDSYSKIKITNGDVLVSWSATLGVYIWDKGDALLNQHIFKVAFDKEDIDKEFFIYTVKVALESMSLFAHGSTMRHVVKKDFDETQVAFPSKTEQVSFSNIVKQADKSKFMRSKSQFIEMFGNDKYPMIKLGNYTDLTWGDTKTTKNSYVPEGYLAYSASGPDGKLDHFDYDCEGIVLSAIGADCGKTWFASGKWSCIKNTIRFWSISDELDNRFLYFATREKDFWPRRGGAQPFIPQGDARNCSIPLPPISLQRKFVEISEQADKSKLICLLWKHCHCRDVYTK